MFGAIIGDRVIGHWPDQPIIVRSHPDSHAEYDYQIYLSATQLPDLASDFSNTSSETGVWLSKESPEPISLSICPNEIETQYNYLIKQNHRWKVFFKESNIEPLKIFYNDLETPESQQATVEKILKFLEITETLHVMR